MKTQENFENINTSERTTRFVVSMVAIVAAIESPLVGSTLFAVVNLLAIALATVAIIGWDPLRALTQRKGSEGIVYVPHKRDDYQHGHHA